jgi:hypothetical protein
MTARPKAAPGPSSLNGLLNDDNEASLDGAEGEFPSYLEPWKSVLVDAGIMSVHDLRKEIAPGQIREYADYLADVSSALFGCCGKQADLVLTGSCILTRS